MGLTTPTPAPNLYPELQVRGLVVVGGLGHGHLPKEGVVAQKNGDFGIRTFKFWQSYGGHRGENKRPEGPKCWVLPGHVVDFGGINGAMKKAARERGNCSLPGVPYLLVLRGPSCQTWGSSWSSPICWWRLQGTPEPRTEGVTGGVGGKHQSCVLIWE